MKETLSRKQVVDGMAEAMDVLSGEMTNFVKDVYDAGFKAGKASAMDDFNYTMFALQANIGNKNLSDTDFRKLVTSVIARLPAPAEGSGASIGVIAHA